MKSQRIPEHKMNYTGEVGQALENTANNGTHNGALKKEAGVKQINPNVEK
ncbi:hypothetical protein ACFFIX_20220 [Metabacillus herbersteinensis]|uniref:Small, acid-soluble spore protein K n=1 Tax=Metabacillus herbersteinensis TaxID=283816 RepID=A0ABV6GJM3_9BACI